MLSVKLKGGPASGETIAVEYVQRDLFVVVSEMAEIKITKITDLLDVPPITFHRYECVFGDYEYVGAVSEAEARAEFQKNRAYFRTLY